MVSVKFKNKWNLFEEQLFSKEQIDCRNLMALARLQSWMSVPRGTKTLEIEIFSCSIEAKESQLTSTVHDF